MSGARGDKFCDRHQDSRVGDFSDGSLQFGCKDVFRFLTKAQAMNQIQGNVFSINFQSGKTEVVVKTTRSRDNPVAQDLGVVSEFVSAIKQTACTVSTAVYHLLHDDKAFS